MKSAFYLTMGGQMALPQFRTRSPIVGLVQLAF